jgi:hypothetical protein
VREKLLVHARKARTTITKGNFTLLSDTLNASALRLMMMTMTMMMMMIVMMMLMMMLVTKLMIMMMMMISAHTCIENFKY